MMPEPGRVFTREPLSRAELEEVRVQSSELGAVDPGYAPRVRIHKLARTALHYLDRVAELEKERDEAMAVLDWAEAPTESGGVTLNVIGRIRALNAKRIIEGNQRAGKLIERADRAEADLAAAQEALKDAHEVAGHVGRWIGHPGKPLDEMDVIRDLERVQEVIADVLARGGGQQETG